MTSKPNDMTKLDYIGNKWADKLANWGAEDDSLSKQDRLTVDTMTWLPKRLSTWE